MCLFHGWPARFVRLVLSTLMPMALHPLTQHRHAEHEHTSPQLVFAESLVMVRRFKNLLQQAKMKSQTLGWFACCEASLCSAASQFFHQFVPSHCDAQGISPSLITVNVPTVVSFTGAATGDKAAACHILKAQRRTRLCM